MFSSFRTDEKRGTDLINVRAWAWGTAFSSLVITKSGELGGGVKGDVNPNNFTNFSGIRTLVESFGIAPTHSL